MPGFKEVIPPNPGNKEPDNKERRNVYGPSRLKRGMLIGFLSVLGLAPMEGQARAQEPESSPKTTESRGTREMSGIELEALDAGEGVELEGKAMDGMPRNPLLDENLKKIPDASKDLESAFDKIKQALADFQSAKEDLVTQAGEDGAYSHAERVDQAVKKLETARENLKKAANDFYPDSTFSDSKKGGVLSYFINRLIQAIGGGFAAIDQDYYKKNVEAPFRAWRNNLVLRIDRAVEEALDSDGTLVAKVKRNADKLLKQVEDKDEGEAEPSEPDRRETSARGPLNSYGEVASGPSSRRGETRRTTGAAPEDKTKKSYRFGDFEPVSEDDVANLEGGELEKVLEQLSPTEQERLLSVQKEILKKRIKFEREVKPKIERLKKENQDLRQKSGTDRTDKKTKDSATSTYKFGSGSQSITLTEVQLLALSGEKLDEALSKIPPTAAIKLLEKQKSLLENVRKGDRKATKDNQGASKRIIKLKKDIESLRSPDDRK